MAGSTSTQRADVDTCRFVSRSIHRDRQTATRTPRAADLERPNQATAFSGHVLGKLAFAVQLDLTTAWSGHSRVPLAVQDQDINHVCLFRRAPVSNEGRRHSLARSDVSPRQNAHRHWHS